jgi:peptidylprolyl isomerase
MRRRLPRLALLLALGAAVAAGGCGSDDEDDGAATLPPEQSETTEQSPAAVQKALEDTSERPLIPKPTGTPPRRLVKEDIVKGKGRPARPGDTLTVQYAGVTFSTGEQFDASWDRGQPFTFRLGRGRVIEGWDRGLVGMRKGGRRMLTIPPEQGYGANGSPPVIGPNETLVFVVDLVGLR